MDLLAKQTGPVGRHADVHPVCIPQKPAQYSHDTQAEPLRLNATYLSLTFAQNKSFMVVYIPSFMSGNFTRSACGVY